jgi:hypothetical protein
MRSEWKAVLLSCGLILLSALWLALGEGWSRAVAAFVLGGLVTTMLFGWSLGFDARSLRWLWGAAGEEWTAEELKKLGPEWCVYHDIPDGRGNWDHVVVGPPGVFTIDSKNLSEPAVIDDGGLRSGRLRHSGRTARGSAVRMKEKLQAQTGVVVWVQAVVAVWGDLTDGVVVRDRVLYVPGSRLVETLCARPGRLDEAKRTRYAAAVATIASSSSGTRDRV